MKIIQISDMHITDKENKKANVIKFDKELVRNRINQFYNEISGYCYIGETLVFLTVGDIINYDGSYSLAEIFFGTLKEIFADYKLEFLFVPGNHDLNLSKKGNELVEFDNFISKYTSDEYDFNAQPIYIKEIEGIRFILSNSVYEKKSDYGKINIDEFRRFDVNDGILVFHHYMHSVGDDDTAAIANFDALKEEIQRNNILFCLMGHVHITKNIDVLNNVNYIVSPKLFNDIGALSFNLIDVINEKISKVEQHSYYQDILCKRCEIIYPVEVNENLGIEKQTYNCVPDYI